MLVPQLGAALRQRLPALQHMPPGAQCKVQCKVQCKGICTFRTSARTARGARCGAPHLDLNGR